MTKATNSTESMESYADYDLYLPDDPLYEECDEESYTEFLDSLPRDDADPSPEACDDSDDPPGGGDDARCGGETDEDDARADESDECSSPDEPSEEASECHNRMIARRGEEAAARYLEMCGYTILERNWKCPFGEADIICENEDGDILVFVEVKTRTNVAKGLPEESVTPKKRARYEKIAACYIRDYDKCDMRVRFDIFSILVSGESRALLRHYINAFGRA